MPSVSVRSTGKFCVHEQVLDYIRSLGAHAVRGNQDDKALKDWLQWKAGSPLVSPDATVPEQ